MRVYSPEEMPLRLEITKKIVLAARSIKNMRPLPQEELVAAVEAWHGAFASVPTKDLASLYRIGLERRCWNAEQFFGFWELKVQAEAVRKQHEESLKEQQQPQKSLPIPEFISESWGKDIGRQYDPISKKEKR